MRCSNSSDDPVMKQIIRTVTERSHLAQKHHYRAVVCRALYCLTCCHCTHCHCAYLTIVMLSQLQQPSGVKLIASLQTLLCSFGIN